MTVTAFDQVPESMQDLKEWCRKIAVALNGAMQGKTNNTGSVTLTANAGTTTLTEVHGRVGQNTQIFFFPTTANAATEFGAGTLYASARSVANNTFTLTHANNAQTDRTFGYVLIG